MCLLFLAFTAWAMPVAAQNFTLDVPKQWTLQMVPDQKDGQPKARFTSDSDRILADIAYLHGRDGSLLKTSDLRDILSSMAGDSVAKSVEGRVTAVPFGKPDAGIYVRLTSRDPKADAKYLTVAVHRNGRELSLGLLYSNDDNGAMLAQFLTVLQSVKPAGTGAAATGKTAGTAKSAPPAGGSDSWGAISVDATRGDTDPPYGVGGGDTQSEAEANAQSFCRDSGGKRCKVQVAYTQCGAWAVSGTSSGSGIGATERTAGQQAVAACGGKGCSVLVADCN
jgi:hypothetical protein